MMRYPAKPYEGEENYIFVSYCHKDKDRVFPIIERLSKDGYRVWYDEGIDPGSEWPEIIAQHLNGCRACIAFITDNSLNSHNCRREINYALLKNKDFISVVLETVEMTPGMEMQMSATQSIFKYKLRDEIEFFDKLYCAKFLEDCKESRIDPPIPRPIPRPIPGQGPIPESNLNPGPRTIPEPKRKEVCWLLHERLNRKVILNTGETKFGRKIEICDYIIRDNDTVGRYHARIVNQASRCVLIDNTSLNKTYLNNEPIIPEKPYLLNEGDSIMFSNEKFFFHRTVE